ncbi:cyclin-domain-containing protein, partial [Chlamydoabsidia padenii]
SMMDRIAYVDALVDMNAMVIEAIWPNTRQSQGSIVPLRCFIQQVLKRSRTTYSTLQTAFFYLFRARPAILHHLDQSTLRDTNDAYIHCGRRMFLASLVVAAKFVQDKTYRNSAWAQAAGLPVKEINTAERVFLNLLNYRLYVAQTTFDQWHELLHTHV